ncbi:MAG: hypothetical protein AAF708_12035 [Deinococcota bacterium]
MFATMFTKPWHYLKFLSVVMVLASLYSLAQAQLSPALIDSDDFLIEPIELDDVDFGGTDLDGVELGQQASINWSTGEVRVTGVGQATGGMTPAQGRLVGGRRARENALILLNHVVRDVEIITGITIGDYLVQDESLEAPFIEAIQAAQFIEDSETSNFVRTANIGTTTVTIDASVQLYGENSISALVLPGFQDFYAGAAVQPERDLPFVVAELGDHSWQASAVQVEGNYTGLVIDASAFGVNPAMCPEIMFGGGMEDGGQKIYGIESVDRSQLGSRGVATYFGSVTGASSDPRVGDNPLVIQALGIEERNGVLTGHPIISPEDAERIRLENDLTGFLEDGGVTVASRNVILIMTEDGTDVFASR